MAEEATAVAHYLLLSFGDFSFAVELRLRQLSQHRNLALPVCFEDENPVAKMVVVVVAVVRVLACDVVGRIAKLEGSEDVDDAVASEKSIVVGTSTRFDVAELHIPFDDSNGDGSDQEV